ncbi:MAG: hypothetical protein IT430_07840 [Phycisphaerales bacterium]|nr:hypothetical protein [Phycisphaerales bacterium]
MSIAELPQCCYVVTARTGRDLLIMTHAALLTLRHHHAGARVVLLTDVPTQSSCRQLYPALMDAVDETIVIDSGLENGPASSRFVKTRMREAVRGDLIYFDIDTVVLRPVDALVDHDCALCGAEYDLSKGGRFDSVLLDKFRRAGWPAPVCPYLSSGVLFMRDDEQGRRVGARWHEYWRATREIMGDTDQPSLHRATVEAGASVHLVPEDYNQPVRDMPQKLKRPAVLHYTTRAALNKPYVLMHHLMRHLEEHGTLDVRALERARDRNDPWVSPGPGIKGNWYTGRYGAAAREAARRAVRFALRKA